jgi:3-phosphoinositide dependent protein kinase-1
METLTTTEKPNLSSSKNTESLPTETYLPSTESQPTITTPKPDNEIQETNLESPLEVKIPQLPAHLTPPEPVEI